MARAFSRRGAFIVLEGGDRCGKSTHSRSLVARLRGEGAAVERMHFPDRSTRIGATIDAYLTGGCELDDAAVHLLFASNRWEARETLLGHLAAGTSVVCDRYAFSGVAFSAAKPRAALSVEWCKAADAGLPAPDLIVCLDLDVADAASRQSFGEERYERETMQQRVRDVFRTEFEPTVPGWHTLDAARPMEDVHADVYGLAAAEVDRQRCDATATALGALWEGN
tara:strand:+ start:36 stop:707 length:672 start_codon:yes stop_codon:yes gene_type:complete